MGDVLVTVRHWLPIMTYCPVNGLPDFIYVSITFKNEFQELYEIRRTIKKIVRGRKRFMEELAQDVFNQYPTATEVSLRLLFDRHTIIIRRNQ